LQLVTHTGVIFPAMPPYLLDDLTSDRKAWAHGTLEPNRFRTVFIP
jgi:hypothetical protein